MTVIPAKPEQRLELAGALERTGAVDLLAHLGDVAPDDRAHCERVGETAMALMMKVSGSRSLAIAAGFAGSLHDVGKIDPEVQAIIAPARRLTPEEKEVINAKHTTLGALMISELEPDEEDSGLVDMAATSAFYHHHSPRKLVDLPEPAIVTRVVQVADFFDAMQDDARAYHYGKPLSSREAIEAIRFRLNNEGAMDNVMRFTVAQMDAHEMNLLASEDAQALTQTA